MTAERVRESLPWVPATCKVLSCEEFNSSSVFEGARNLLSWDRQSECDQETITFINQEQKRIFSDYNLVRTWLALNLATSLSYLGEAGFDHPVRIACIEDDYAFVEYVLQHDLLEFIKNSFCLRSLSMAQLVCQYINPIKLHKLGSTLWHTTC